MAHNPEIGQLLFSNAHVYGTEVPAYVEHGLDLIGDAVSRGEWGTNPIGNVGAEFVNDVFSMRSYCWCEGDQHPDGCPPNFSHGDLEITWYKHAHRGATMSRQVSRGEWWRIVRECMDSVLATEEAR